MNCPSCGHENRDGARFCRECGQSLAPELTCASCGRLNTAESRFCDGCGAPVSRPAAQPDRDPRSYTPKHLVDKILQSKSALEGERKQVTVLFADVKGSTELAGSLDPEEWHIILDRFFQILTDGVHRFEGTVNQYTGDGIMALFGAPIAHEDHAQRACYSALRLRDEVRDYANELRVERGLNFGVRIGLNSGEVVVGKIGDDLRMDYTARGHTVGLAQRMEALAESGRICVSESTAHLVEGYLELASLGCSPVKGARDPIEIFELVGVGSMRTRLDVARARGFSRLIGRTDELATLDAALEQALEGQGRVVGVVGEAGVGKSRLCYEFAERCRGREIAVYEAHCPAHGKTIPLLPIHQLLRAYFSIDEGDRGQTAREKIAGRLLLLDRSFDADLPLIWDFLGVPDPARPAPEADPGARQRRLFAWVRRLVHARSQLEPAVLLFDDLHWIDPGSNAWVAELVEAADATQTLVLLNFRPEYSAPWMQRAHYQQHPLTALGAEETRTLAADLLGPDPSVAGLPDMIAARTGGNPFFTEEVVQALDESEHLAGTRGAYRLATPIDQIEVPTTVHATLSARIDRLGEREKHVLQTSAVIGKEFPDAILQEIVELPDEDLAHALSVLRAGEFLYERALYPTLEYAFKHPLTQEVAYQSQLAQRRRPVHAAVARAIEAREPERADENAALLAYHWDEADEVERAAHWHERAARVIGVVDFRESARHLERVRELVDRLPDSPEQRARTVEVIARILTWRARGAVGEVEATQLFADAERLAGGDLLRLTRARCSYAYYCLYHGREREAVQQAERAMQDADRLGDRELRATVSFPFALCDYFLGRLKQGEATCSAAIELCEGDPDFGAETFGISPYLAALGTRGGIRALQGRTGEAAGDFEQLEELLGNADPASTRAYSFQVMRCFQVNLHLLTGDGASALAETRQAIQGLEGRGNPAADHFTRHFLGVAHALNGEWADGLATLEDTLKSMREKNTFLQLEAETLTWSAHCRLELGDLEGVRATLAETPAVTERIGARLHLPHLHLIEARLAMRSGAGDEEIESALGAAFDAARAMGARLWEPFVELARVEWRELRGDDTGRQAARSEAVRLLRAMGATGHAERVGRELGL